jgi:hypothetical protein
VWSKSEFDSPGASARVRPSIASETGGATVTVVVAGVAGEILVRWRPRPRPSNEEKTAWHKPDESIGHRREGSRGGRSLVRSVALSGDGPAARPW